MKNYFLKPNLIVKLTVIGAIALGEAIILDNISFARQKDINKRELKEVSLKKHNQYRQKHNSGNLIWDDNLEKTAQNWANNLAQTGNFAHSTSKQRNGAGENLYVYYTTANTAGTGFLGEQAVKSWYEEIKDYDFNNPQFSLATGHFTQVVWKNSKNLGCATAQGTKNMEGKLYNAFYVVCQYNPPGNVQGQFMKNVLR